MKHCEHCGFEIGEGAKFCSECGRAQGQTAPAKRKTSASAYVLVTVVVLGAITAGVLWLIGEREKCTSAGYGELISAHLEEWQGAVELASSTSRIALSPQIQRLQEIKKETTELEIPDCAEEAHGFLLDSMDSMIRALLEFSADGSDSMVEAYMTAAATKMGAFADAVEKLDE